MRLRLGLLISLLSVAGIATAAQQYSSGFGVGFDSDRMFKVVYNFGQDNLNQIHLGSGYFHSETQKAPREADKSKTTVVPFSLGYTRFFQISPAKFNNQLFSTIGMTFAGRNVSEKGSDSDFNRTDDSVTVNTGVEYRVNSQFSVGGYVGLVQYSVERSQGDERQTAGTEILRNASVYVNYQF